MRLCCEANTRGCCGRWGTVSFGGFYILGHNFARWEQFCGIFGEIVRIVSWFDVGKGVGSVRFPWNPDSSWCCGLGERYSWQP